MFIGGIISELTGAVDGTARTTSESYVTFLLYYSIISVFVESMNYLYSCTLF
jgi:hypothetical protein